MAEQIALVFALIIWAAIVTPVLWVVMLSVIWRHALYVFALIFFGTGVLGFLINLYWSK